MRLKYFHLVILVVAFTLAGKLPNGSAFSFEGIDMQSKFGERFKAELDVILEEEGKLEVQIGDENDYRRLELDRPRVIDDFFILPSAETKGRRKTVRVISKRPLFYPSFYMVVRGTFKGGTILESYLITVDFRQSLALNVQGKTKSKPDELSSGEMVDLVNGEKSAADSEISAGIEEEPAHEIKSPETAEIERKKVPEKENPETPAREASVQTKKPNMPPWVGAPAWMAKPPSTIWGNRGKDSYFPGATWVLPSVSPPAMPPMDPPQPVLNREEQKSSLTGLSYGPLARGETLLSIAKKLDVGPANAERVATALWMDNPESFLYGNMNGLKEGSQIHLRDLEKRLEEIDSRIAKQIVRSQWQEWRIIQDKRSSREKEGFNGSTQEIPLPSENEEQKKMIFEMLQTWKKSWEIGDLDQHLALFSDRATGRFEGDIANLRFLKKRIFSRHKNVKLGIKHASLTVNGGQAMVSFGQSFSSGKIESYGRKDIGIVWESGAWKILKEKFKVKEYIEKSDSSSEVQSTSNGKIFSRERTLPVPYVVHASSHFDYQMATKVVNDLRELGFNAYSSPVNISGNRKIYRVFVGRFPGMDITQERVSELRKHAISQNAIPVKFPYTFLMDEYELEYEAESLIRNLRSRGLSPLLFTFSEKEFLNPRFRVFLGAFATEKNAARLSAELDDQKLSFKLITP